MHLPALLVVHYYCTLVAGQLYAARCRVGIRDRRGRNRRSWSPRVGAAVVAVGQRGGICRGRCGRIRNRKLNGTASIGITCRYCKRSIRNINRGVISLQLEPGDSDKRIIKTGPPRNATTGKNIDRPRHRWPELCRYLEVFSKEEKLRGMQLPVSTNHHIQ